MAISGNTDRCAPRYRRSPVKIRRHLTYANVTATIALFLALGTGAVYAAGEIGSRELKNDSVRTQDLKDRRAVRGKDVQRNTLGGREIDEGSLDGDRILSLDGAQAGNCDPADSVWTDCASQVVNLNNPSQLLVTGTGGFYSEGAAASAECELRIDGQDANASEGPGEENSDNTSVVAADGFARTLVTGNLRSRERTQSRSPASRWEQTTREFVLPRLLSSRSRPADLRDPGRASYSP